MTRKTHEAFNDFLHNTVNFSGAEREQASKSQNYLRDQLDTYSANHWADGFPGLIDGDFLSGSFGRKTAVAPLDDIDVFMIPNGQGLIVVRDGYQLNITVEGQ